MNRIYTIYKIVNLINDKVYIGFDSNWPKRIRDHKTRSKKGQAKLYMAIRKYGWNNFTYIPIYQSPDLDYTKTVMESYFITEYDSYNKGYNATTGGEGSCGHKKTKEIQDRINKKLTGKSKPSGFGEIISTAMSGISKSISHKINISINHSDVSGVNNPMYGKKHLDETIQKQKERAVNRPKISCIHCRKVSDISNFNRWHGDNCKGAKK